MTPDDRYTYPGSGGVLVNRLEIRDAGLLDRVLNDYASTAWAVIRTREIPPHPGFEYLQSIHREMFGRVLAWAGEVRQTDVQATGTGIAYARPEFIPDSLSWLFVKLEREDFLAGLDRDTFADRLADRWGELSAIHPFRDGNTRSQSAYVSALAERAGHPIDWPAVDVPTLRSLRVSAIAGNHEPLASYLGDRLVEPPSIGDGLHFDWRVSDVARLANQDTPTRPGLGAGNSSRDPKHRPPSAGADRGLGR